MTRHLALPLTLMTLLAFLALGVSLFAQDAPDQRTRFSQAVEAYNHGEYADAVAGFSALAETGLVNGALAYNLGNAMLTSGDTGRAILWYERARRLMPRDPDLAFNLDFARSLVKDEPMAQENALVRVLFFWKDMLSQRSLQILTLSCNAAFWLCLVAMRLFPRLRLKSLATLAVLATLLFAPTLLYLEYGSRFAPQAVILAPEAPVRAGRSELATELFTLHAGSKVLVEAKENGYLRIRFAADKVGWIPAEAAAVI